MPLNVTNLSVDLAPRNPHHLKLKNPVMVASGTFGYDGYGRGVSPEVDLGLLGAVIPKTVTRSPRAGNPEPLWHPKSFREGAEAGECIFLNSVGLTNPGIEAALAQMTPHWANLGATIVISLASDSVEKFGEMAAMTRGVGGFQALELNLSCPNVRNGSFFSHKAKLTRAAVSTVKASTDLPVLAKLAPNVPDIVAIAKAAVSGGADALTISNTIPAMAIDVDARRPVLGGITGGLSGPGLRAVSLALVYRVAKAVDVPIIGVGGIFSGRHALEYLMAGATAVQVGSASLANLRAPFRILEELQSHLRQLGVGEISEVIGAAQ